MKVYYCPKCGQKGMIRRIGASGCVHCLAKPLFVPRYSDFRYWMSLALIVVGLPALQIALIVITELSVWWSVLCALVDIAIFSAYYRSISRPLPIDYVTGLDSYNVGLPQKVPSEVRIEIVSQTKKIHNLDVCIAVFEKPSQAPKFRDIYKDGTFPVFFYRKNRKQTPLVDAYIPHFDCIPKDMFRPGSEFIALNEKGVQIAKCKVFKIYQ